MIEGRSGQFLPPTLEQMVARLQSAVAALATEMDLRSDEYDTRFGVQCYSIEDPRMSAEEQVERILYMEHFS